MHHIQKNCTDVFDQVYVNFILKRHTETCRFNYFNTNDNSPFIYLTGKRKRLPKRRPRRKKRRRLQQKLNNSAFIFRTYLFMRPNRLKQCNMPQLIQAMCSLMFNWNLCYVSFFVYHLLLEPTCYVRNKTLQTRIRCYVLVRSLAILLPKYYIYSKHRLIQLLIIRQFA